MHTIFWVLSSRKTNGMLKLRLKRGVERNEIEDRAVWYNDRKARAMEISQNNSNEWVVRNMNGETEKENNMDMLGCRFH